MSPVGWDTSLSFPIGVQGLGWSCWAPPAAPRGGGHPSVGGLVTPQHGRGDTLVRGNWRVLPTGGVCVWMCPVPGCSPWVRGPRGGAGRGLPPVPTPQVTPHVAHPRLCPSKPLSPPSSTQINFTVAIDFTASNGEHGAPVRPPRGGSGGTHLSPTPTPTPPREPLAVHLAALPEPLPAQRLHHGPQGGG